MTANGCIVLAIVLCMFLKPSFAGFEKRNLFPNVTVTVANDRDKDVFCMCKGSKFSDALHVLKAGERLSYVFTQIAFPMRWCYLYIDDNKQGFFWAYTVRSRCTMCFWSIKEQPYLYRPDRNRWERQKLYRPPSLMIKGKEDQKPRL
ncbi:unnamed protein product [Ilex paraguariensis]|uniref:S-protein homolog n=1 Tax=Ilex paraguariensis TaxID=185542 RepID=A0ABC8S323_9AQUA